MLFVYGKIPKVALADFSKGFHSQNFPQIDFKSDK
jgi:hypothetical protein